MTHRCPVRLPCNALLVTVLRTIERWPDLLAEARVSPDREKALTHLQLNMEQSAEVLRRLVEHEMAE